MVSEQLVAAFRPQASELLVEGGHNLDLSQHSHIWFHLNFIDADLYGIEEDDDWAAIPSEGVLAAAKATIRPTWSRRRPWTVDTRRAAGIPTALLV
ncbi:hypothetical protein J7E68_05490 [Microbacterium sp. ISL-103]|uniref:hypothetical protein n=1 Tax=Microbacterium sp. ISL-103 TaxID=2819156 RepID=UPI001BE7F542|nr:hypothetical protein [Microbacterium sp. ISL-103]MBT2474041.1 hypothetical protein [Microbacterium sp. ISL-103]